MGRCLLVQQVPVTMLISTSVLTTLGGPCPLVCVPASPGLEAPPQGQGPAL